jgi:hypothetical protein
LKGARSEVDSGLVGKGSQRLSARGKVEIVLRLLRREDPKLLSMELGVTAARLSKWREQFLKSGREALKKHPQDARVLYYYKNKQFKEEEMAM